MNFHRKRFALITWILLLIFGQSLPAAEKAEEKADDKTEITTFRAEVCSGCHLEQYEFMKSSRHWIAGDERTPVNLQECSTCHGQLEEHVLSAGGNTEEGMTAFTPKLTTMTAIQ